MKYDGIRVYPRDYQKTKESCGTATGSTRRCRLEGCTGIRVMVRWPNGKVTWPCTKGMVPGPHENSLVIL